MTSVINSNQIQMKSRAFESNLLVHHVWFSLDLNQIMIWIGPSLLQMQHVSVARWHRSCCL